MRAQIVMNMCSVDICATKDTVLQRKWSITLFFFILNVTECDRTYKRPPKCTQHVGKTTSSCSKCKLCENCKQSWCGSNKHVANLAIAHMVCKQCIKDPQGSQCHKCGKRCHLCNARNKEGRYVKDPCIGTCGGRERVFRGEETAQMFSKWLFARKRAGFTAVAHNLSGYDGYFFLNIYSIIAPNQILLYTKGPKSLTWKLKEV